jgi:N utilization substance protein B
MTDRQLQRSIRELALQVLYLIDARQADVDEAVELALAQPVLADDEAEALAQPLSDEHKARAADIARQAYAVHETADALATELAPTWPTNRQPAVDRAMLRLAYYEMASGITPVKVAINEAVELAKRFSTERSPAFINGVLDKMMKRVEQGEVVSPDAANPTDPWLADALEDEARNSKLEDSAQDD